MVKSAEYKQNILNYLSDHLLGLTVTEISNKLGYSRNTIYRYLDLLEAAGQVYKKKVGVYTLYYSEDRNLLNKEMVLSFFKGLLSNLKQAFPNKELLFKEFGRKIAEHMIFPISNEDIDFLKRLKDSNDESFLKSIIKYIQNFNILNDSIEIAEIERDIENNKSIITFVNSNMLEKSDDYIYYFYLFTGLVEKKLSEYTGKDVRFEILEFDFFEKSENNYIKISFDFQILLPEIKTKEFKDYIIPDSDLIDIDLIKNHLDTQNLILIIQCCLFKKKVLILNEKEFLHNHLLNFLKFIFQDSFEIDISIEKSETYKKNKEFFKNSLVLQDNKIINQKDDMFSLKNARIEKIIIDQFFSQYDSKKSLIELNNEISKVFILSKELAENISQLIQLEGKKKIDSNILIHSLEEAHNTKISLPYLAFLIDIVENYFQVSIPSMWKFFISRPS